MRTIQTIPYVLLHLIAAAPIAAQAPEPVLGEFPIRRATPTADPSRNQWATEELSEAAKEELKHFFELLTHRDSLTLEAVEQFVTTDIACARLRPDLKQVYSDGSITVFRPAEHATDIISVDANGLLAELNRLIEPLTDAEPVTLRVKLFQVMSDEGAASTRSFIQLCGMSSTGRLQQNAVALCEWTLQPDGPPLLSGISFESYEESLLHGASKTLFSDCTTSVLGHNKSFQQQLTRGVDHWRDRFESNWLFSFYGHEGIAVGDADGDGLDDIYLCQPIGLPNRLFVQNPDGSATDRSTDASVDFLDACSSALFVDLDNDADQDLILVTTNTVVFLNNDGTGRFQIENSHEVNSNLTSVTAADPDLDGDLDVYVCAGRTATGINDVKEMFPLPWHDANNGHANLYLRNDGEFRFVDATVESGLDVNNRRWSWAAAWEDYDNDGDVDLYVANDFGRNNLYRNEGGRFHDIAESTGVEDSSAGMGVTWGDYNNDGRMDLYVSNMFSAAGNRIAYQRRFKATESEEVKRAIQRHARGNSLFENTDDDDFRDVSVEAGVLMGRWAWASMFTDLNNDGREDLIVLNGFITQPSEVDL